MARTDGLFEIRQAGYVSPIDGASIWLRGTNSYINFGLTPGSAGYGIRDNGGVMEFKNSGGSWTSFGSGGGGSPGGANNEIQYNNSGSFGGMSGITYDEINGAIVLDNTLNTNAILETSGGTGTRKGLVVQIGASSNNNGASVSIFSGEGFTKGGDITLQGGNTNTGSGGAAILRAGLSTLGDDGIAQVESDKEIYLSNILQTKGLLIDTLNIDKLYTFPTQDGNSGDLMQTNGSGALSFLDSKAFFQYLGSIKGHDTEFTYDVNGNIDTKVFPSISVTLTYSYDVNGNLETVTDGTYTKTFQYDINGNLTDILYT